jgi:hypothetical protein
MAITYCSDAMPHDVSQPRAVVLLQALEDAPDLVDDIFLLASRACSYCPRMLVTPQLLPPLLDTAMVSPQHRNAADLVHVMSWLDCFVCMDVQMDCRFLTCLCLVTDA